MSPKIHMEPRKFTNSQILNKKNKHGRLTCYDFKIYYRAGSNINSMILAQKQAYYNTTLQIQSPEIHPVYTVN